MPSNDNNTLWFQRSLNKQSANQARMAIARTGRALPCVVTAVNGSLVTVSFQVQSSQPYTLPQLTLPKAEGPWIRSPTAVGDYGITISADTSIGGINGAGAGVAQVSTNYGNLSSLVWIPVASSAFPAAPNANQAWVNGPAGAILSDEAQTASVTVSANLVTIKAGGSTWTFAPGAFTLSTGIIAESHQHGGVASGSSDTGPPIV
jgi:hypothetical protein